MPEETQIISAENEGDETKLVPVSESIKYRKRAQSAEKELAQLNEKLEQAMAENKNLNARLGNIEFEQKLTGHLKDAGIVDLETAVLLVEKRIEGKDENEITQIIDQLKEQKPFLFEQPQPSQVSRFSAKSAGVKPHNATGREHIERQGRQAARSGSRADMMKYLSARRQLSHDGGKFPLKKT